MRVILGLAAAVVLAACEKPETPAAEPVPPVSEMVASAPEGVPAASPTPDTRTAALQLSCDGDSFRVAFEDARAVVVTVDGGSTELARLDVQPAAPVGVATYTNGMITFTREGGQGAATVIRYAKGRMAFQDCAIGQN
jgi:hypothetical protein